MKKIGFVFALVALLLLHSAVVSAKECVEWKTEVYECGTTWVPADGDPLSTGQWWPVPVWCEREVCVKWAKSGQPSEKMYRFASAETFSYEVEIGEEVTVTGTLVRVVAIGGETTGWAIDLNQPLEVEGETLSRIEIDLVNMDIDLASFEGATVIATGILAKHQGIERTYWVLEI